MQAQLWNSSSFFFYNGAKPNPPMRMAIPSCTLCTCAYCTCMAWRLALSLRGGNSPVKVVSPSPCMCMSPFPVVSPSPCMCISPFAVASPSPTANLPVPLTVCLGHACTLCAKVPPAGISFKITPSGEILFKSTLNGEICRLTQRNNVIQLQQGGGLWLVWRIMVRKRIKKELKKEKEKNDEVVISEKVEEKVVS